MAENPNVGPICGKISSSFEPGSCNISQLPPLTLAYVGDTVFDLFVRTRLATRTGFTVGTLHKKAAAQVCAGAQARAANAIMGLLSEQELAFFKRGRNAHMGSVPKHAQIADYRAATGLEALLGYLYLAGEDERLCELMQQIFHFFETEEG